MDWWFKLGTASQLVVVATIGFFTGPLINWCIYNLAYESRPISPWCRALFRGLIPENSAATKLFAVTEKYSAAHLPIVGWWFLRNERIFHGRYFWFRPAFLELAWPMFVGWLFWYEVSGGLLPRLALPPGEKLVPSLHLHFVAHLLLCFFMAIATFIDFDEWMIPDWVTVPGTIIGLLGSALFPTWHLWVDVTDLNTGAWPSTLHYDSPWRWASWVGLDALLIGIGCFTLWCFALADRRCILRRGWWKAIVYFFAGLVRSPTWKYLFLLWLSGVVGMIVAWPFLDIARQQSFLSSLIGMAVAGSIVWMVRTVASLAIGKEALGFGDVTLMAMVGAFLGWQPAVIAFFISPMIALVFVLIRFALTRDTYTPFGPYLCVGVLVTVLGWDELWNHRFQDVLMVMGPIIAQLSAVACLLMGGLLWGWRLFKQLIFSTK